MINKWNIYPGQPFSTKYCSYQRGPAKVCGVMLLETTFETVSLN